MATKRKRFVHEIHVPPATAHAVVASERYLLTMDGSEVDPGTTVVTESEYDRREDGSVYARAVAGTAPDDSAGTDDAVSAEDTEDTEGGEDGDGADAGGASAPVRMEQTSEISAAAPDGSFTMDSTVPLPRGLGTMRTLQRFAPTTDATVTRVSTEVTVEVDLPIVGGKIAKKLIDGTEGSTARSLHRVEVLAGE